MKKIHLILMSILLSSITSFAQFGFTLAGYSVDSQGFSASFTVGETFNQRIVTSDFNLKNGILQPDYRTSSTTPDQPNIQVSVFPNPVFDFLNVEVDFSEKFSFEISDFSGKRVRHGALGNGKIDVANLAKGMYVLSLTFEDNSRYSYKFVK